MNPPRTLIDTNGRPFQLGCQLTDGEGGESIVYSVPNNATLAAKVYKAPQSTEKLEKLRGMIALAKPELVSISSWPTAVLLDGVTRQLRGFVMPLLTNYEPIWRLHNPLERLKHFPSAGWRFQVRVAQNLAAAFDEVHKAGHLVGDINEKNAFVSPQALVRLIDCDSFQVRVNGKNYLCEVGVHRYIPPELQGKSLTGFARNENHDRFGMAVLLYQLLFVGRHPYAGVYHGTGEPSIQDHIADFRFTQGPLSRTWGMEPQPYTPTLADISPEVGMLLRRAFERGSEQGTRPKASDWLHALKQLETSIIECPVDSGHTYWKGAKNCVWCRLAARGGPEYYFGVDGKSSTFSLDDPRFDDILRRLAKAQQLEIPEDSAAYDVEKLLKTRPISSEASQLKANWEQMKQRHVNLQQELKSRPPSVEIARLKANWELLRQNALSEQEEIKTKPNPAPIIQLKTACDDLLRRYQKRKEEVKVRPLPADVIRLNEACEALKQRSLQQQREEQIAELKEEEIRKKNEKQFSEQLNERLRECERRMLLELDELSETIEGERQSRRLLTRTLLLSTLLGCLLMPFGFYRATFGIVGALTSLLFGVWLAIHLAIARYTPAHQERSRIRKNMKRARRKIDDELEQAKHKWQLDKAKTKKAREAKRQRAQVAINEAQEAYQTKVNQELKKRQHELNQAEQEVRNAVNAYRRLVDQQLTARRHELEKTERAPREAEKNYRDRVELEQNSTLHELEQAEKAVRDAETSYRRRLNDESTAERAKLDQAESRIAQLTKSRHDCIRGYSNDHRQMTSEIDRVLQGYRELLQPYQAERQRLTAGAESIARRRHMRLHLIAEAEIPDIGPKRKQTLASYNIFTADDIDESVIRRIKHFGEVRTGSLVMWKAQVLREFRFDPATGVSPVELRALSHKYRMRQQQLLGEMDLHLTKLELLVSTCRVALQRMLLEQKDAVLAREQAKINLRSIHQ